MSEVKFMKGNEALAEAAIRAGLDAYFGYPITPQSEILEYLSIHIPKRGGVVLQAESEVAAINMIYGAAGAGARVMTTTSSPGFSLMQEGISYIASAQLPCLLANIVRGGPGLGTIQPSQGDYFQAVKGGGHGDYHLIVLAPSTVQEMADFVYLGFDLADKYLTPVMILTDGALGQGMEKVTFPEYDPAKMKIEKPWATTGKSSGRPKNVVTSLYLKPEKMEQINEELQAKYAKIRANEILWEEYLTEDAEVLFTAFGLGSRIARKTIQLAREKGIKAGLFRPKTVWPFPYKRLKELAQQVDVIMDVELNAGQMVEDVRLAVEGAVPVLFHGRMGGMIPTPEEVLEKLEANLNGIRAGNRPQEVAL